MHRLFLVIPVLVLLVCIRIFETTLFYDPLLSFFHSDFASASLPELDLLKFLVSTGFRFLANTVLSLVVLWVLFRNREIIKVSLVIYAVLFVVLMLLLVLLLQSDAVGEHLPLFYVRRFLIQPLFLLILLPAFYVQQKNKA